MFKGCLPTHGLIAGRGPSGIVNEKIWRDKFVVLETHIFRTEHLVWKPFYSTPVYPNQILGPVQFSGQPPKFNES